MDLHVAEGRQFQRTTPDTRTAGMTGRTSKEGADRSCPLSKGKGRESEARKQGEQGASRVLKGSSDTKLRLKIAGIKAIMS
jgi:hypothetical protein